MGLLGIFSLNSCAQRAGALGEKTIKLDNFNFSTPITNIFPESYISTEWGADWYDIPSLSSNGTVLYRKEICKDYDGNDIWITYSNMGYCYADKLLSMYDYIFCSADFATTLDGHIFAVGGHISDMTQEDCNKFISLLSKQYGEPERSTGGFSCSLYKWKLKDRTLMFAIHETDEHNTLNIERIYHKEDKKLEFREGKRRDRTEGYFFIFEGEWYDIFVNTNCLKRGNITYCY